jgi:TonB family protein
VRLRWAAPRGERWRARFGAWLGASGVLHAVLAAALLLWPDPRPPQPEQLPAPAFDIVFDGGGAEQPLEEPPEGVEAPPSPPPAPPPAPPSVPAPPLPVPPVQQALPSPPLPQPPPVPTPPVPSPPVQQAMPLPPRTELRLPERFELPLPPSAPPPPRQQTAEQVPRLPGIWAPDGVQLGRPPTPPPGRTGARGFDLSVDPRMMQGRATRDPTLSVVGARVGADWRAAFSRWLDQNLGYPEGAIRRGEQGAVRVLITASPDGTVRSVRMLSPSTSPSLNTGTSQPFAGARLPAFPPGSDPNGVTVELTVRYIMTGP